MEFRPTGADVFRADTAARIVQFAPARRLPTITDFAANLTAAGILLTYSASPGAIARQTARFVDRVLRGARAGVIPRALLLQAERVIE